MNAIVRLVYRNFRASLDRVTLFFELVFPLFFIYIEGYAFAGLIPDGFSLGGRVIKYPVFLAAGAIVFTIINGGTTAGQLLWFDRKNGMFEQILMGPFTRAQYIFSIVASTILVCVSAAALTFVVALPVLLEDVLSYLTPAGLLYIVASLTLGSLFFGAMAIASSVWLKSSEAFQVVNSFLFFVFLFISPVFYPLETAPSAIQIVSYVNPLTFVTDIFRAGLLGLNAPLVVYETIALVAVSSVMFFVALLTFNKIKIKV